MTIININLYIIMEGDNIEKVILTFYGLGKCSNYQAHVNIFNSCGDLIFSSMTKDGKIFLSLPFNKAYTVLAIFQNQIIVSSFYVDCIYNKFVFFFQSSIIHLNKVTFYLSDFYYNNLKIEKGEILIWPKI